MQPGPERAELPVVTKMQVLGKPLTSEMIPRAVVLRNISSKFLLRVLPTKLMGLVYKKFLRKV